MKTLREQAEEIKAKGSPLTIEQIIALLEKREARKSKRDKRSAKAWERRDKFNEAQNRLDAKLSKMTNGEKNQYFENVREQSVKNQLPSSMR